MKKMPLDKNHGFFEKKFLVKFFII